MPVMNFDLQDGKPPVSFSLRPDDCERLKQAALGVVDAWSALPEKYTGQQAQSWVCGPFISALRVLDAALREEQKR